VQEKDEVKENRKGAGENEMEGKKRRCRRRTR